LGPSGKSPVADLTKPPPKEKPIRLLAQKIIRLAYPPRCLSCGEESDADSVLCQTCWPEAHFIAGHVCDACGVPLIGAAAETDLCESCFAFPPAWKQGRAVGLYQGPLRRMTLALKHGDRQDIAQHMARWMLNAGSNLLTTETCLVPVPLHWTRMLRRRFNQSVLIANAMARTTAVRVIPDALQRFRATKPQKDMSRTERFENQRNAIRAHPQRLAMITGKPILLIDDVMTTGATLSACAEACLDAGAASVNALVFARVARPE
jgi:ComF family protein